MPVKTLKKIEKDIEGNDLGKARDRLHGLISTYPNELKLRRKLGDIYYKLDHPSMAGRYWYLEEKKTPEMSKACSKFEEAMGEDSYNIVRALKFKGDKEMIERLDLDQFSYPLRNEVKETLLEEPEDPLADKLIVYGFFSIIIVIGLLAIVGGYALFTWII
ncbi:DNA helicase [Alkalihalobacillus macyae]|uniref:DUF6584 family protein n=1 Tax=Guptibacillus hwajinpoensis TaxID=208199 RepID=UPI00273BC331|nr:DUF6584 family protein [Alkalihalobacillus macyae]MDP4551907.1 DNA helicase [Alkalihalobacillus macyae]